MDRKHDLGPLLFLGWNEYTPGGVQRNKNNTSVKSLFFCVIAYCLDAVCIVNQTDLFANTLFCRRNVYQSFFLSVSMQIDWKLNQIDNNHTWEVNPDHVASAWSLKFTPHSYLHKSWYWTIVRFDLQQKNKKNCLYCLFRWCGNIRFIGFERMIQLFGVFSKYYLRHAVKFNEQMWKNQKLKVNLTKQTNAWMDIHWICCISFVVVVVVVLMLLLFL